METITDKKAKKEHKLRLLRLSKALDAVLVKRAKQAQRSVNSQIIYELMFREEAK